MLGQFFMFDYDGRNKSHKYFQFEDKRPEGRIPYATLILIELYIRSKKQTANQWKADKSLSVVNWEKNGKKVISEPINYSVILNHIKRHGQFNPSSLNLPYISEQFIDVTTAFGVTSHFLIDDTKPQNHYQMWNDQMFLGAKYPITPKLNREGILVSSFFDAFVRRIIQNRISLVETSNNFFTFEWLFLFKDLVNDSISSIEIVLHLIYNKAQFDPLPSWSFDEQKLGSKYGRRFKDKLKWVYQISGNTLNIEKHQKSLFWLQELRNHLNHFDPPSFCMTMEECVATLNAVVDIGMIHLIMRKTLGLGVSISLINLVLQPMIIFKPEEKFLKRAPLDIQNEGYNTCRWPQE
jgi:hypothetical protein